MKFGKYLLFSVFVAGCVSHQDVTAPPVDIKTLPGFSNEGLRSLDATTFRTYSQPDVKKARTEIVGAKCVLKGSGYVAKYTTPAIVNMPNYGKNTAPVSVSCEHGGKIMSETITIKNISAEKRVKNMRQSASQGGLFLAIVGEVASAAMDIGGDRPGDVYGYGDNQSVTFK